METSSLAFGLGAKFMGRKESNRMILKKLKSLKAKFGLDLLVVGAAWGKPGTWFVFHDKQVAAVEVTVHFFYSFLIYDIWFLDPVELVR